jgi:hypothetical protein
MLALPLFTWGGAAGFSWVVPSLYTILVPAVVYCSFEAACRYIDRMEESPFDFMSKDYTDEERDQIDDLEDELSKPRPQKRDKNKPDLAPSSHQNKQTALFLASWFQKRIKDAIFYYSFLSNIFS